MGYIGVRRVFIPEIIRKYTDDHWSLISLNLSSSDDETLRAIELWEEVESWWSDMELFDKDDYPDLKFESLLPYRVVELRNAYYKEEYGE